MLATQHRRGCAGCCPKAAEGALEEADSVTRGLLASAEAHASDAAAAAADGALSDAPAAVQGMERAAKVRALITKGYDHKTPICTSFDQSFVTRSAKVCALAWGTCCCFSDHHDHVFIPFRCNYTCCCRACQYQLTPAHCSRRELTGAVQQSWRQASVTAKGYDHNSRGD